MPNLHDIERRIKSVNSTKQITRTMQMVAAAKIGKANQRLADATPYSASMLEMVQNVAVNAAGSENALLQDHDEIKNVLVIAIASDRGLAGGFNSNVLRAVDKRYHKMASRGIGVQVIACGKKAISYLNFRKIPMPLEFRDLSADPTLEEAEAIAQHAINGYTNGDYDSVILVWNHAKNAAEQVLRERNLLPFDDQMIMHNVDTTAISGAGISGKKGEAAEAEEAEAPVGDPRSDVIYEPSSDAVLDNLLPSFVRTLVHFALIDSAAGEQGARRNAMKSATDNANEMVDTLQRYYNRVRQGAITTEITEIVGGAAALEE